MESAPTRRTSDISRPGSPIADRSTQPSQESVDAHQLNQAINLIQENHPCAALPILLDLANSNNPTALNLLGDMHFCGIGVQQNFAEATRYYELAAHHGNASSSNNLGFACQYGLAQTQAIEPKPHEAMIHYLQTLRITMLARNESVDQIDIKLQYYLIKVGELDSQDIQTLNRLQETILASAQEDLQNRDYLTAYKKLFFLSKDTNITKENKATALRLLGKMYYQDLGVSQNIKQTINCLKLSADLGDVQACRLLGIIYGADSEYCDYQLAITWHQKAGGVSISEIEALKAKIVTRWILYLKHPDEVRYSTAINDLIFLENAPGKVYYDTGQAFLQGSFGIIDTKRAFSFIYQAAITYAYPDAYIPLGDLYSCEESKYGNAQKCYVLSGQPIGIIDSKMAALKITVLNNAKKNLVDSKNKQAIEKLNFLDSLGVGEAHDMLRELSLKAAENKLRIEQAQKEKEREEMLAAISNTASGIFSAISKSFTTIGGNIHSPPKTPQKLNHFEDL